MVYMCVCVCRNCPTSVENQTSVETLCPKMSNFWSWHFQTHCFHLSLTLWDTLFPLNFYTPRHIVSNKVDTFRHTVTAKVWHFQAHSYRCSLILSDTLFQLKHDTFTRFRHTVSTKAWHFQTHCFHRSLTLSKTLFPLKFDTFKDTVSTKVWYFRPTVSTKAWLFQTHCLNY